MAYKSDDGTEVDFADWPTCPNCGAEYEDAYEWGGYSHSDDGEYTCDCGAVFSWEREITVQYHTKIISVAPPSATAESGGGE